MASPAAIAHWSARARSSAGTVGFVPTMGALHEGHLDLVRRAKKACDKVVCSIFVNPLQFNNPEDLARYPQQPAEDQALLESVGCDALFFPTKQDLFAGFTPTTYDLGGLDRHWEGPSRPGHFQGVVNVVERLFFHVRPDAAYFGEKDRQQLAIVQFVAKNQHWPERIAPCPTVRTADGLALSSRNLRLSDGERGDAIVLSQALLATRSLAFTASVNDTLAAGLGLLHAVPGVQVDYFGIAHPETLEPLLDWGELTEAIALVAAQVGPVRLIDNMTLRR
ncbi:MAG: pantoate--beta-alanine ligase [Flavobacteriales bacterium]|nr:pantoate--beta-alanine ligase [Flavobacteriales bacterium]